MPIFIAAILDWLGGVIGLSGLWFWTTFRTVAGAAAQRIAATSAGQWLVAIGSLFTALLAIPEWRDKIAAFILQKSGIDIAADDLENPEAWKIAIGVRAAELINQTLGTEIESIYPPNEFKQAILDKVTIDIVNGGGELIPEATVTQIKTQVKNTQDIFSGLTGNAIAPILATDTVSKKLQKKRNNNRKYQKQYRATHDRFQLWVAPDMVQAVEDFKAQIAQIIAQRPPQ